MTQFLARLSLTATCKQLRNYTAKENNKKKKSNKMQPKMFFLFSIKKKNFLTNLNLTIKKIISIKNDNIKIFLNLFAAQFKILFCFTIFFLFFLFRLFN